MSGSSLRSESPPRVNANESDDEEYDESLGMSGGAMEEVVRVVTPLGAEFIVSGQRMSSTDAECYLWIPLDVSPCAFSLRHRFAFSSAHQFRSQESYESLLPSAARPQLSDHRALFAQVRFHYHVDSVVGIVVRELPRICHRPVESATVREYDTEARKALSTLDVIGELRHHLAPPSNLMTTTGVVQQLIHHRFLAERQMIDDSCLSEFRLQQLTVLAKEQLARNQLFRLLGFVIIQTDFELTVDDQAVLLTSLHSAGMAHLLDKVSPNLLWRYFVAPRSRRPNHSYCYIHSACDAFRFLAEQLQGEMRGLRFVTVSDVDQIPAGGQTIFTADERRSTDSLLFYLLHWLPTCTGSVDYFVTQVAVLRYLWTLTLCPRFSLPGILAQSGSNYRRRIMCESLALSSSSCVVAATEKGLMVLRFEENHAVVEGQTYPVLLKADANEPFSRGVVLDRALRTVDDDEWIELVELDTLPALKRALRVAPMRDVEISGWNRSSGNLCEERPRHSKYSPAQTTYQSEALATAKAIGPNAPLLPGGPNPRGSGPLDIPCHPLPSRDTPGGGSSACARPDVEACDRPDVPLFRCRVQRFADRRRGKDEYAEVLLVPLEGKKNTMMPPEDVVVINTCISQCLEEANLSSSEDDVNRTVTILLRKTREAPPHILMPVQAANCFLKHLSDSWRSTTEREEGDGTNADVWKRMARIALRIE